MVFIILGGILLVLYVLIKFGIIKPAFIFNHIFSSNFANTASEKYNSFSRATFSQITCKHQNLEQKDSLLLCSDCGKIIVND